MQIFSLPVFSSASLLAVAEFFSAWHGTSLLYSGGEGDCASRSFLGLFPFQSASVYGQRIDLCRGATTDSIQVINPWEGLQYYFFDSLPPDDLAFGWFGYGMGAFADKDRLLPYRPSTLPDAYWQRCAVVLQFDLLAQTASVIVDMESIAQLGEDEREWALRLSNGGGWKEFLDGLPLHSNSYKRKRNPIPPLLDLSKYREPFIQKIEAAHELIRAGEIYQVNLSEEFTFKSSRLPFSFFRQIAELNPAPFSAYIRYQGVSIVSSSPERFLFKTGDCLETRPIKGTMPRGKDSQEDQRLRQALLDSPKERAELLMITDLMRNDLGRVSAVGTVETLDIWRCEAYSNVFHLLSIIRSKVREGITPLEVIRSCFPGGSITGCPKIRAMEVIDALEQRPRGIYTGSIGFLKGNGDFDLNIAIRTMVHEGDLFALQLGSGIVIDSIPEQEFQEILCKGESFFHTLQTEEIRCL